MSGVSYREQARCELAEWFRREITPLLARLPDGMVVAPVGDGLPVIVRNLCPGAQLGWGKSKVAQ